MHNGIIRLIRQYRESHDTLPAFADAVDLHHESNRFFDTIGPYFWTLPSDDWVDVLVNPHNKDKKYREKYKDWKHDWPRFLEYAKSSDRNQLRDNFLRLIYNKVQRSLAYFRVKTEVLETDDESEGEHRDGSNAQADTYANVQSDQDSEDDTSFPSEQRTKAQQQTPHQAVSSHQTPPPANMVSFGTHHGSLMSSSPPTSVSEDIRMKDKKRYRSPSRSEASRKSIKSGSAPQLSSGDVLHSGFQAFLDGYDKNAAITPKRPSAQRTPTQDTIQNQRSSMAEASATVTEVPRTHGLSTYFTPLSLSQSLDGCVAKASMTATPSGRSLDRTGSGRDITPSQQESTLTDNPFNIRPGSTTPSPSAATSTSISRKTMIVKLHTDASTYKPSVRLDTETAFRDFFAIVAGRIQRLLGAREVVDLDLQVQPDRREQSMVGPWQILNSADDEDTNITAVSRSHHS